MKKLFIVGLFCAAAMLASCGESDIDSSELDRLGEPDITTTATTVTTAAPTATETTTTTVTQSVTESSTTTTTTVTTTTIKFEPPPSDDPEIGYGQAFATQAAPATTTAKKAVTTKKTTTTAKPTQTVEVQLKVTAKIDQLFKGLRDKEQEEKDKQDKDKQDSSAAGPDSSKPDSSESLPDISETESKEPDSSESAESDGSSDSADSSDEDSSSDSAGDDSSSDDSTASVDDPQPDGSAAESEPVVLTSAVRAVASVNEKQYPAEYTATSFEDFRGYMSFFYEADVVEKYLKLYPKSFFDSKVLVLNTVGQSAGKTCELKFKKATGNINTKTITLDVDRNELKNPEKVSSTLLVQVAVAKSDYQKYAKSGVKWRITFRKYYDYPLARAALDKCGWNLKSAFDYAASIKYYGHTADMPQVDTVTTEWYAEYGFKNGKGNCYVMAAMFCEMARLLGYDCHQISGKVPLMRGGYGPHSWVEIYIDGKTYICDPDFTNETKLDGYLKEYGQSGTWKYIKLSDMSK